MIRNIFVLALILLFSGLIGCSGSSISEGVKLSSIRTPDPNRKPIEMKISRAALRSAVADLGTLNRARLVEVFFREQEVGGSPPEYRMFDIAPGSAYDILGLKNADVLVAADDYIVPSAPVFRTYVSLLPTQRDGSIEIRRMGQSMLFHYNFVD